tara:strand:- start:2729 stop:3427 length:699 start_codon:yes stop_codon:yes gene_type:complete
MNIFSILSRRLTEKQKEEIIKYFSSGKTIDELSKKFKCTKLTISRNLKKSLGDQKYKKLINESKFSAVNSKNKEIQDFSTIDINSREEFHQEKNIYEKNTYKNSDEQLLNSKQFIEIAPLDFEIESTQQKDLSSIPIMDIDFPKTVYMIVDRKIELETKYLKDFPEWQFLSQNELNRKTIQIYCDQKIAKRLCNSEQKVIKVPNTDVFLIVAPILISRGISRIVTEDKLIAL